MKSGWVQILLFAFLFADGDCCEEVSEALSDDLTALDSDLDDLDEGIIEEDWGW